MFVILALILTFGGLIALDELLYLFYKADARKREAKREINLIEQTELNINELLSQQIREFLKTGKVPAKYYENKYYYADSDGFNEVMSDIIIMYRKQIIEILNKKTKKNIYHTKKGEILVIKLAPYHYSFVLSDESDSEDSISRTGIWQHKKSKKDLLIRWKNAMIEYGFTVYKEDSERITKNWATFVYYEYGVKVYVLIDK